MAQCFLCCTKNSFLYSTAIQTILYLPKTPALTAFCETYGLNDRRFSGNINDVENAIDYDCVLEKVKNHRMLSKAFLDNALSCFSNGD